MYQYFYLLPFTFYLSTFYLFIIIDTPIYQLSTPRLTSCRPQPSSKPILATSYELRPRLVEMVQNHSFLGKEDENPYLHLRDFEQTCDCLHIEGMSDETLRWKLFPFSLKGRARIWYDRTVESKQGDWGSLRSSFCIDFFPIRRVVDQRVKVLNFKQLEIGRAHV